MSKEREEMIEKKEKLNLEISNVESFINSDDFKTINPARMSIYNMQLMAMKLYAQLLVEQIAWIND